MIKAVLEAISVDGKPGFEVMRIPERLRLSERGNPLGGEGTEKKSNCYSNMRTRILRFDTDDPVIRGMLTRVVLRTGAPGEASLFSGSPVLSEFTRSLGFELKRLEDFNVGTFSKQVSYFSHIEGCPKRRVAQRFLTAIYLDIISSLPDNQTTFTLSTGVVPELLLSNGFIRRWSEGYRPYVHDTLSPVPTNPKWLLIPSAEEKARTSIDPRPTAVDVSYHDPTLQKLLMEWLWTEVESVEGMRVQVPASMKRFLDTLEMNDEGRWVATGRGTGQWLLNLRIAIRGDGVMVQKAWARSLLQAGISAGVVVVEPSAAMLLNSPERDTKNAPDTRRWASAENLSMLGKELERRRSSSVVDELVYHAFSCITQSSIRIGDILSLKTSDFEPDTGSGVHAVLLSTKVDGSGCRRVVLNNSVYSHLLAARDATEEVRSRAPEGMSAYIFVYESNRRGNTRIITTDKFLIWLAKACDHLGIEHITAAMIRRWYQTETHRFAREKGLSELAMRPISGHSHSSTTVNYYVYDDIRSYLEDTNLKDMCEQPIRGVVPSTEWVGKEEDLVQSGSGYCRNDECDVAGAMTCLMCRGFLTTPSRIPEMEEVLENINRRIKSLVYNTHERKHVLAVKGLVIEYLAVMYSMRRDGR